MYLRAEKRRLGGPEGWCEPITVSYEAFLMARTLRSQKQGGSLLSACVIRISQLYVVSPMLYRSWSQLSLRSLNEADRCYPVSSRSLSQLKNRLLTLRHDDDASLAYRVSLRFHSVLLVSCGSTLSLRFRGISITFQMCTASDGHSPSRASTKVDHYYPVSFRFHSVLIVSCS